MGSIHQVSPNGCGNKFPAVLNRYMQNENKEFRDAIMGEGRHISEEYESRINKAAEYMNDGHGGAAASLAHHVGLQKHQQQPVVQWERFLPFRTVKVLLVENDDSTRQVVSALLRNCSYEVTAAANALQAWKILEDLTNHIDLVLTEVVMPRLSGSGLLCKIMSHKTCKNIPVIMMSSNDSMGTVFKCLSKGAVDFLVKPIRKNELKNLWQHVWRRCQSSSGSVNESDIQTEKSAKSKSTDDSDNDTSSNDGDDNESIGMNTRDGSDNGSGTQSSWTKYAVEVDSSQPLSPYDQVANPIDSTCAQLTYSKIGTFCNEWVPMTSSRECQEQKRTADDFMGNDLEIRVPRNSETQDESYPTDAVSTKPTNGSVDKLPVSDPKNEGLLGVGSSNTSDEPSTEAADLIGVIDNSCKVSEGKGKSIGGSIELPSLELSLKRPRSTGGGGTETHHDRNVLKPSDLSAFSRFRSSATSIKKPTGYEGSCSPLDNSSMKEKVDVVRTAAVVVVGGGQPIQHQVQVHHHYYHHHLHLNSMQQLQVPPDHDKKCGSLNVFAGAVEGNSASYSLNGCNSGSNCGSNGQKGSSTALDTRGINMESDNGIAERSGSGSGSGSGVYQNPFAQREAALNKFRQKRKERNFQKKIRYQSRKTLAEQRHRVHGQFVRWAADEQTSRKANS